MSMRLQSTEIHAVAEVARAGSDGAVNIGKRETE